ncbi:MAG: hypothetical protein QM809_06370 [Gordonia sp. (in: high G+C Gram-positive bacteria)]|uniref:hypothetical protein n=1 Tax=Gordonia sp. (in: high G+C Gram-positive bacteria) TaxID=84139 RepID=UPI0039E4E1EE
MLLPGDLGEVGDELRSPGVLLGHRLHHAGRHRRHLGHLLGDLLGEELLHLRLLRGPRGGLGEAVVRDDVQRAPHRGHREDHRGGGDQHGEGTE